MNRKQRKLIMLAMTTALIGVIVIQIFWITNAYSIISDRFFHKVENSIDELLETNEVALTIELIDDIDKRGFTGVSNMESEKKYAANIDSSEFLFEKYSIDIERLLFEPNAEKLLRMKSQDEEYSSDTFSHFESKENGSIAIERKKQTVDFQELKGDSNSQMFKLLRSFLSTYPKFSGTQMAERIDSLIRINLGDLRPRFEYRFDLIEHRTDSMDLLEDQGYFLHGTGNFRKKLFPSSSSDQSPELIIRVVDPVKSVVKQMRLILFSSIFFLLVIIYCFYFTLNSLIRQGKLSEMKSDFINNMTHELKTPITTISLATEALLDRNLKMAPEKVYNMSKLISKENNRLKSQVERVLQMERLDRNKINLDLSDVHLNGFLEEICENVRIQVESKNGQITWALKASKDFVKIDELHIGNVFYNLIDNAIKYSKERIEIFINAYSQKEKLYIEIEDKGIGIPKDLQPRIFERFYRVPTGNLHDVKGFGLGLSYIKEMMELHQGSVKVISKPGKGSTFTLIFPLINKPN